MNTVQVWAHRGASGTLPENTLPAYAEAAKVGADGIELDIQLTKDGQIVVCHDERIDRTSNGTGFVKDYTLEELRGFEFHKTYPDYPHAQIPTMAEVLDLIQPTGLMINIELKTGLFFYEGIEEKILKLVREKKMEDRVLYSSFNHYSIRKIQTLNPAAKTAFLTCDGWIDLPAYGKKYGVNALHPDFHNLQYPDFMEQADREGLDVNVWTVNTKEDILWCAAKGVHAVITNYPAMALEVLKEAGYRADKA